jgi:hypothetical protein
MFNKKHCINILIFSVFLITVFISDLNANTTIQTTDPSLPLVKGRSIITCNIRMNDKEKPVKCLVMGNIGDYVLLAATDQNNNSYKNIIFIATLLSSKLGYSYLKQNRIGFSGDLSKYISKYSKYSVNV